MSDTVCPHCHRSYDEPAAAPMTRKQVLDAVRRFSEKLDRKMMERQVDYFAAKNREQLDRLTGRQGDR